jgi:hypothetical protein
MNKLVDILNRAAVHNPAIIQGQRPTESASRVEFSIESSELVQ